jgi:tetratricopeptide (TPR) repeat protein
MQKNELGLTDMVIASSLNNYGVLHYDVGYYNESEKDFAAAIAIIQSNRSQSEMPYAIVLNNKAMLFQAMGRYEEAVKILQEAIDVAVKLESSTSRNHLKFLSNLALLYQQMNKYDEAENIYVRIEKYIESKKKPEYANLLDNMAALYVMMHKDEKVEDMLQQSALIYKSNFGEDHPAYAKVISDLGNFYLYKGRYPEAEPLLKKALDIRQSTLGENHPLNVQSQEDMAILYWKMKSLDKAYPLYSNVMAKSRDFINRYFSPMSEAEKARYWDLLAQRFHAESVEYHLALVEDAAAQLFFLLHIPAGQATDVALDELDDLLDMLAEVALLFLGQHGRVCGDPGREAPVERLLDGHVEHGAPNHDDEIAHGHGAVVRSGRIGCAEQHKVRAGETRGDLDEVGG